jgi:hypothetical protein
MELGRRDAGLSIEGLFVARSAPGSTGEFRPLVACLNGDAATVNPTSARSWSMPSTSVSSRLGAAITLLSCASG